MPGSPSSGPARESPQAVIVRRAISVMRARDKLGPTVRRLMSGILNEAKKMGKRRVCWQGLTFGP